MLRALLRLLGTTPSGNEQRESYQFTGRVSTDKRACGYLEGWPPDFRLNETTRAIALF